MSFLFHEVALNASRSFRSSGRLRGPAVHARHRFVGPFRLDFGLVLGRAQGLHRFKDLFDSSGFQSRFGGGFGFIEGHVFDVGDVVII